MRLTGALTVLIRQRQLHFTVARPRRRSRDHEIEDFPAVPRDVAVEESAQSLLAVAGAEGGEAPEGGVEAGGTDYCGEVLFGLGEG